MNITEILKAAGTTALSVAFPGVAPAVIGAVNAFLPSEEKLPVTATGEEVDARLMTLPEADRSRVYELEFELAMLNVKESHETLRTMLEFEGNNQQSTRPKIAYQSFQVVGTCSILLSAAIAYQIIQGDVDITSLALVILSILAPFFVLLKAYFGILQEEKESLHQLGDGVERPKTRLLSKLFKSG